jgi:F-type H+-transporting ATPase subunit alpha
VLQQFERGFLALMRSDHKDLLAEIREKRELTEDIRDRLRVVAEAFSKVFG